MSNLADAVGRDSDALLMTGDWGTGFRLTESTWGDFAGLESVGGVEAGGIVEADGGCLSCLVGRRLSIVR